MKNKKLTFLIIMVSLLITSGCGNNNSNDNTSENNSTQNGIVNGDYTENEAVDSNDTVGDVSVPYTIEKKTYTKDKISLEYPQISGVDNDIVRKWNNFIEEYTMQSINDLTALDTYEEKYEVKTQNDKLISILVNTYVNIDGSTHPNSYKRTYNIDLINGDNIRINSSNQVSDYATNIFENKDYTVKDSSLEEAFKEYLSSAYENKSALEGEISNYDIILDKKDENGNYETPMGYSYYEDGKTILCMGVPHALGDFIEVIMD